MPETTPTCTTASPEALLDAALAPQGFARARRATTWRRQHAGREQLVGLRRSRQGGRQAAIYFSEAAPGAAQGPCFELSPVAPLSNTYWWPDPLAPDDAQALAAQIEQLVLPFFAAGADAAQAARPGWPQALAGLRAASPPFHCSAEGTWWRERGRLIDLVIVEALALGRFLRPWVAVWHHDLPQGLSGGVPDGVTHAAAYTLGRDGIEGAPLQALFIVQALPPAGLPGLVAAALNHFAQIQDVNDVRAQVRSEYRRLLEPPA